MRNGFAKRLAAVLLALCVAAALPFASAFAEEKTFVVTYSGGEHGVFTETTIDEWKDANQIEDENVKTVPTTGGYAKVAVRLPAGSKLPAAPAITISNSKYGELNNGATVGQNAGDAQGAYTQGAQIARNYELVPEFFITSDTDVTYTLRYVMNGAEDVEVTPSRVGRAPLDTFTGAGLNEAAPVSVQEFSLNVNATLAADSRLSYANGVFTLKDEAAQAGGALQFTFYYDQVTHVTTTTEYVDGGTIINYNDVNLVGGAGVVGGGGAGEGEGEGGEVIEEDETPQAGGDQTEPGSETEPGGEDIEEDETPQAGVDEAATGISMPMVVGGVAILLLIALIVLLALRKRRSGEGEE